MSTAKLTPEKNRIISTGDAIREGLIEAAKEDESVIFFAQGVQDPSSVYGTLTGLDKHIDKKRIIETPVSENAVVGTAIGAAIVGKRPIISFHRVEFALLAMEQIVNNAAKFHYISGGRHRIPLVIRIVIGRGWGQGPEHSQSLESMFALFPGLKVIMPCYPGDAKGMIIAAVRDNNPVVIIEHRWCHYVKGNTPEGCYISDLSSPKILRNGGDVTLVATSYMTLEAMRAAEKLADYGVEVTVFDLRIIRPLCMKDIISSVKKTGRLLTIDTGFKQFGIGSEIVSQVATECFEDLISPPKRIGMPDHPTPSSRGLVRDVYPDAIKIVREISNLVNLSSDKVESCVNELERDREGLPIDVPDPFFKGPF